MLTPTTIHPSTNPSIHPSIHPSTVKVRTAYRELTAVDLDIDAADSNVYNCKALNMHDKRGPCYPNS